MNGFARRATASAAAFAGLMLFSGIGARAGLIALYSFNGTLTDSSGNGKTAKDSGTPAYVPGAPFGGKAIDFDGSGKALVTVPINMSVAAMPQVTFGAWVYAKSAANPQYGIISIDDGNFDRTLGIDSRPATSGANWAAFIGGSAVGTIPAATNKWVFFAVSYDQSSGPGTYAYYVNTGGGTTVLSGNDAFDGDSVTTGVTIGKNPNFDQPFQGYVSNAFFYAGLLTKDQIDALVTKGPSAIPK
ncbi:MAG: LamG-like jellyroll fold domain-containing protein [Vulcanimicrobiaceae bacterium]